MNISYRVELTCEEIAELNELTAYFGDCERLFPLFFKQVVAIFTL